MSVALCDTNVVVKWFHDEPGAETLAARRVALASDEGIVSLRVLDLTFYEMGNVLRRAGQPARVVAGALEQLHEVCGPGIVMGRGHVAAVATVAETARLSFYDAAYVAIAAQYDLTLLTMDKAMIRAGGVLPTVYLESLGAA
jgi:predicted nucleic acid-binding protein